MHRGEKIVGAGQSKDKVGDGVESIILVCVAL